MQKKALIGMIFVLIALIMMGISLAMPWYKIEMKMSFLGMSESIDIEYYLDHAEANIGDNSTEISYDDESVEDEESIETFRTTQTMVFVGILGCIIGLIGALMVMTEKMNRVVGAFLILIAVILCLIAPIYMMVTLPGQFEEGSEASSTGSPFEKIGKDFFGSEKEEAMGVSMEVTWGGSTGWFLPIIAMILCFIALILVVLSKPAPALVPVQFAVDQPAPPPVAPQPEAPRSFQIEGEGFPQAPLAQPLGQPEGEQFQCPQCSRIFILASKIRPAILNCPYCGLEGLVE